MCHLRCLLSGTCQQIPGVFFFSVLSSASVVFLYSSHKEIRRSYRKRLGVKKMIFVQILINCLFWLINIYNWCVQQLFHTECAGLKFVLKKCFGSFESRAVSAPCIRTNDFDEDAVRPFWKPVGRRVNLLQIRLVGPYSATFWGNRITIAL